MVLDLQAEASMNAQALKKFVEENQNLATECTNLLAQCNRWERECTLYENDREALMDSGNEAHERAKEAEARVQVLEEEVEQLSDELQRYKRKLDFCKVVVVVWLLLLQEFLLANEMRLFRQCIGDICNFWFGFSCMCVSDRE